MDRRRLVILGGGMVAGYAAQQMVEMELPQGELAIISADDHLPYERPPLSKGFLAGRDNEEGIRINTDEFYRTHQIEVRLGQVVSAVDPKGKRLILKSGGEFGFEKLLIATGARPRRLTVPGADLKPVLYLRSLDDSKAIREAARSVQRALVIGGGFIAMEVAAVLASQRIGVNMVFPEDHILERFFTPQMSAFFENYYQERGIRIFRKASVAALLGNDMVHEAVLDTGQRVPCGLVVAGIGVEPVTEVLAGSGIEVADGVVVNEYLETNQSHIYAAGDMANYPDLLFGKRRRVEHWDNAVSQGRHCGRLLMGERVRFMHVPYFFSDVFDLSYEYWGDASDADEVVHRGEVSSEGFSVWWLRQGRVVAAFAMNRPDEERNAAPKWIETRQPVSGQVLADPGRSIAAALL